MANDNIVSVKDLKVRYVYTDKQVDAIKGISFDIQKGDFVSVIGLNNSGKTTMLKTLNGLIPNVISARIKGDINVANLNTMTEPVGVLSQQIGFVFDNPFNQVSYTTENARNELAFGLCNIGLPRDEITQRVKDTAELVGITHLLDKSPMAMSGGQLQRLAIASVLIMQPQVLMLDDCTSQLDPLSAGLIYDILSKLKEQGMTIISVDHNLERVCKYSNKVMLMHDGQLVKYDTPENIFTLDNDLANYGLKTHSAFNISAELIKNNLATGNPKLTFEQLQPDIEKIKV